MQHTGGHVFVVHADLTRFACDEILIPTDAFLDIRPQWHPLQPTREGIDVEAWRAETIRVSDTRPHVDGLPRRRLVNTGGTADRSPEWLFTSIDDALATAASALASAEPRWGRARPLLAVPLFGTGAGGYDARRGEAIDGLITRCTEATRDHEIDIAIVCWLRSDFTAVQARRWSLVGEHDDRAVQLGERARRGGLALFLGAGVSIGAELPGWRELLERVAASRPATKQYAAPGALAEDPWEAASQLKNALGEQELQQAVGEQLEQRAFGLSALQHEAWMSLPRHEGQPAG